MINQNIINYNQSFNSSSEINSILNASIPKIKVIIRKRPLNSREKNEGEKDIISIKNNSRVIVIEQKVGLDLTKYIDKKEFLFDKAYDESSNNEYIYLENIRPMIFKAFYYKSKIACFAYGQTGSGKTFTMMGGKQGYNKGNNSPKSFSVNLGMYLLAGYDIFQILSNDSKFNGFKILISFYEIYCDKLYDLLNKKNKLETREDKKHNINIVGLIEKKVNSINELMEIISFGLSQRTVGKTGANSDSSRSHGIIQIRIINNLDKEHGKITFIDLAGSEREVDKINVNKKTRIDGAEINKSLLALKECIRSLEQEKSHTPFRGSKLTIVLRDSFIGDCKILMIANISPGNNSSDHTLNTLRYADRVKELKKNINSNNDSKHFNINLMKNQSQNIENFLKKKNNNENKNYNLMYSSFSNFNNESKLNNYKGVKAEKKRRNTSTSSSNSIRNNLIKNNKNISGNNILSIKSINNYMPFHTNRNDGSYPLNLFSNSNSSNFLEIANENINNHLNINSNFKNNINKNFTQKSFINEDKNINNLFINKNNTNFGSYSLSFNNTEQIKENNNDKNIIDKEMNDIHLNQRFYSSPSEFNLPSLTELQNKNDKIVELIIQQDTLCKESQQIHINSLCESLKMEMVTFQQYQKKELQISTYIDSMQTIFINQINQITEMNNKLQKLKDLFNQQTKISNMIDEIKNGQNDMVNNLFERNLNNLSQK